LQWQPGANDIAHPLRFAISPFASWRDDVQAAVDSFCWLKATSSA
jgi:hypothetical protein